MGSEGYLLGTAQALIGADPSAGDALSKGGASCNQVTPPMRGYGSILGWNILVARAAYQHGTAASKRLRWCMVSGGYLLGTAQAPIGANSSAGDALSKALHVTMQHHKCVSQEDNGCFRCTCTAHSHAVSASKRLG